jgi:hypothetical protein
MSDSPSSLKDIMGQSTALSTDPVFGSRTLDLGSIFPNPAAPATSPLASSIGSIPNYTPPASTFTPGLAATPTQSASPTLNNNGAGGQPVSGQNATAAGSAGGNFSNPTGQGGSGGDSFGSLPSGGDNSGTWVSGPDSGGGDSYGSLDFSGGGSDGGGDYAA